MFPETGLHIRDDISTLFQSEEMESDSQPGAKMTYSSAAMREHGVRDEDVISWETKLSSVVAVYYQQKEEVPWLHSL